MFSSYNSMNVPSPLHSIELKDDIVIVDAEDNQTIYDEELSNIYETDLGSIVDVSWVKNDKKVTDNDNEIGIQIKTLDDLIQYTDATNYFSEPISCISLIQIESDNLISSVYEHKRLVKDSNEHGKHEEEIDKMKDRKDIGEMTKKEGKNENKEEIHEEEIKVKNLDEVGDLEEEVTEKEEMKERDNYEKGIRGEEIEEQEQLDEDTKNNDDEVEIKEKNSDEVGEHEGEVNEKEEIKERNNYEVRIHEEEIEEQERVNEEEIMIEERRNSDEEIDRKEERSYEEEKLSNSERKFVSVENNENDAITVKEIMSEEVGISHKMVVGTVFPCSFSASSLNPSLTVILQLLYCCRELREEIIEYHKSDRIVNFDSDRQTQAMINNRLFVNELCKLFWEINSNQNLARVPRKFDDFIHIFSNVRDCYRKVLKTIRTIMETSDGINTNVMEQTTNDSTVIKKLFHSTILSKSWCNNCHKLFNEKLKSTSSIPLKLSMSTGIISAQKCIDKFFHIFEASPELKNNSCCDRPNIVSQYQLTNCSDYLLLVIDFSKSSVEDEGNSVPSIELCDEFKLPAVSGPLTYRLQGVIKDTNNALSVECLYDEWWRIDNLGAQRIPLFDLVKDSIVALFVKRIN